MVPDLMCVLRRIVSYVFASSDGFKPLPPPPSYRARWDTRANGLHEPFPAGLPDLGLAVPDECLFLPRCLNMTWSPTWLCLQGCNIGASPIPPTPLQRRTQTYVFRQQQRSAALSCIGKTSSTVHFRALNFFSSRAAMATAFKSSISFL
jgi:hypothetical protein